MKPNGSGLYFKNDAVYSFYLISYDSGTCLHRQRVYFGDGYVKWLGAVVILPDSLYLGAFVPMYSLYVNVMISRGHPGKPDIQPCERMFYSWQP